MAKTNLFNQPQKLIVALNCMFNSIQDGEGTKVIHYADIHAINIALDMPELVEDAEYADIDILHFDGVVLLEGIDIDMLRKCNRGQLGSFYIHLIRIINNGYIETMIDNIRIKLFREACIKLIHPTMQAMILNMNDDRIAIMESPETMKSEEKINELDTLLFQLWLTTDLRMF